MFSFSIDDFQYILERLSQFYIANEDYIPLLQELNYEVHLNEYLCFCYGADYSGQITNPRKIEVFQFVGQIEKHKGYYIQCYNLPNLEECDDTVTLTPSHLYQISDCNHLRQHIFDFHDKTSLFRSTLFYVPALKKLYRIHSLMSFLTLPLYENVSHFDLMIDNLNMLYSYLISPQHYMISLQKKKQILHRLQHSLHLCEESIKAHGSLEQSLSKSDHQK